MTTIQTPLINEEYGANEDCQASQGTGYRSIREGRQTNTSAKKIDSNRRNSQKSTGPRTLRGKKMSSANSFKHGVFAKCVLIRDPDGNESQAEYDNFYALLRQQYMPVGSREEGLVSEIVDLSWRKRRVLRCETGQIDLRLADHRYRRQHMKVSLEGSHTALEPAAELESLTDHLLLPPNEEADKLLRYENMFNKQLRHLNAELDRLQQRRKEAPGPAPITADLGPSKY